MGRTRGDDGVATGYEGDEGADPSGYFGDGGCGCFLELLLVFGLYMIYYWIWG